jgi:hypothetical protein
LIAVGIIILEHIEGAEVGFSSHTSHFVRIGVGVVFVVATFILIFLVIILVVVVVFIFLVVVVFFLVVVFLLFFILVLVAAFIVLIDLLATSAGTAHRIGVEVVVIITTAPLWQVNTAVVTISVSISVCVQVDARWSEPAFFNDNWFNGVDAVSIIKSGEIVGVTVCAIVVHILHFDSFVSCGTCYSFFYISSPSSHRPISSGKFVPVEGHCVSSGLAC